MTGPAAVALRFAQRSGYSKSVLRRVDAGRSAASHDHPNSYSILQRAQLLERFTLLQRRSFPAHEAQEQVAAVAINALMTQQQGGALSKPSSCFRFGGEETAAP